MSATHADSTARLPRRPSNPPRRSVAEIADAVGAQVLCDSGDQNSLITGVVMNSRNVEPGDLYAAVPGTVTHGVKFAEQAINQGALAVLTDPVGAQTLGECSVPVLVVEQVRAALGALCAWFYDHPARAFVSLGVTGTNGKTTTTHLMRSILTAMSVPSGLIGTIDTCVGDTCEPSIHTTPEATDLQPLLAVMAEEHVQACVMEVSSHALAQHRVDGFQVGIAGFTQLSHDHLDFHGTMEDYFRAKAALFTPEHAQRAVICVDDEWGVRLAEQATIPVLTFSTRADRRADWLVHDVLQRADGRQDFTLTRVEDQVSWSTTCPMPGVFNIANSALALLMLQQGGWPLDHTAPVLPHCPAVPGRMELVHPSTGSRDDLPTVVVDFAHTPDAIASAIRTLRSMAQQQIIIVIGAGGNRDTAKRPLMGQAAAQGADLVIVTDDNPRDEDPALIRAAVVAGAQPICEQRGSAVIEVAGRQRAIDVAVCERAGAGSVVLIAGKGHEQGQTANGVTVPFDDRTVAAEALDKLVALGPRSHRGGQE